MTRLWEEHKEGNVRCILCPHRCLIRPGERGVCGARENRDGIIHPITAGIISGYALDPVEKKPLYHFHPGSSILSVGSYGCNMKCDFCQNYQISQSIAGELSPGLSAGELVRRAAATPGNIGIAYTYNEPVIWFEYVTECAKLSKAKGLRNVMVTNGYVNPEPLDELTGVIDAFNIDLKAFSNDFYRRYTGATIQPVLESIRRVASSGSHLEITTLVLPGLNDSPDDMRREASWIAENAGRSVPLHLSRYFPMYRRTTPPTPAGTILRLRDIAMEFLDYVYTGNMAGDDGGSDTRCPSCHSTVIRRSGYIIRPAGMTDDGKCGKCGMQIIAPTDV